ncbi:uncharacterized protein TM35_000012220 [Trypanosoma theileri]|uniref:Transmembrane protein n=1 Tax=Trypanosoma theileri TaxID=67003 RepID=A0A1X0P945_9TRYP|nr:uncharacterized protein TM35_000012220 [Trypanosoma theileri]ORC93345.1 hypothetical protein TM35_000012220 [Trypanosoma theileri]
MTEKSSRFLSLEDSPDDWELLEALEVSPSTTKRKKSDTKDDFIKGFDRTTEVKNEENVGEKSSGVRAEIQERDKKIDPSSSSYDDDDDNRPPEAEKRSYGCQNCSSIDGEGSVTSSRFLLRDRTRSCASAAEEIFMRQFEEDESGQFISSSSIFPSEPNVDKSLMDESEDFIPYGCTFGATPFGSKNVNDYSDDCKELILCFGMCCWDFISHLFLSIDAVSKWLLLTSTASVAIWVVAWIWYEPHDINTCSLLNILGKGAVFMQVLLFGVGPPLFIIGILLPFKTFGATTAEPTWSETEEEDVSEEKTKNNKDDNNKDETQNQPETSSNMQKTDMTMFLRCFFKTREEEEENNEDVQNEEDGIHVKKSSRLVIRLGSVVLLCISVGAITQSVILYCS